jgi:hypothetical protein
MLGIGILRKIAGNKINMKPKQLNQIGMLLALIMLSACSKQNGQSKTEANISNEDSSISLRNVYSVALVGGQGGYLITELENTGKVGITAFQGKWTIKDDLDAVIEDQEVRFTSDTPYATPEGVKSSHVITPGEKFVIIIQGIKGQPDNIFATTKENITKIGLLPLEMTLQDSKLDDHRVKKKTTFEIEKIVKL